MTGRPEFLDRVIEAGVIALLLFAPIPLGSALPWAQGVIEWGAAVLVALTAVRMASRGEIGTRLNPLLLPAVAMVSLVGLQLLVPAGSASPYATWEGFRLLVAYVGLLVVLSNHLVTKRRIVRLVAVLVGWGAVLATAGLVNQILGRQLVLWFSKEAYLDRLTSTFVNANHQALYFSVLLFLALGMLLRPGSRPRRVETAAEAVSVSGDPRETAARPVAPGNLAGRALLVGSALVTGVALVLTASRGGLVATLAGLLVVIGLSAHGRRSRRIPLALGAATVAFAIYATWFGLDAVLRRFSALVNEPLAELRWPIWEATVRMVGEAPLLGIGLAGFQDSFPRYRPLTIPPEQFVDYAHNDYLQLLAETGVVGLAVAGWALVALGVFVLRRWVWRRDPFVRALGIGGLGALAAVVVHSVLDFGLHMPANALLAVLLGALLPAVVSCRNSDAGSWVDLDERRWSLSPRGRKLTVTAAGALAVAATVVVVPSALADWYVQRAAAAAGEVGRSQGAVSVGDLGRAHRDLERAVVLDPWNPVAQAGLAVVAGDLAQRAWQYGVTPDGQRLPSSALTVRLEASHRLFATAYDGYVASLRLRPRAAETHDRFAWLLGQLEVVRRSVRGLPVRPWLDPRLMPLVDSDQSLLPRALVHLGQGIHWDPQNAARHRNLAVFALANLPDGADRARIVGDAFRRALTLDPRLLDEVADRLTGRNGGDAELLRLSVPPRHALLLALAQHLERRNRAEAALAIYGEALALVSGGAAEVDVRLAYSRALLRKGSGARALDQGRRALVIDPRNPDVLVTLAEAYEASGQLAEAEAALVSAAALASGEDARRANDYRGRLSSLLVRRGELKRALLVRGEMLRASPNDPWAHLEMGHILERLGEWSRALYEYQAAQGLATRHWTVQREVARAYARNGLLREASLAYETAVKLRPSEDELRVELANLYARAGWREQALEHYRHVLSVRPDHEGARHGLTAMGLRPGGSRD